jgi:hypothetical protein
LQSISKETIDPANPQLFIAVPIVYGSGYFYHILKHF